MLLLMMLLLFYRTDDFGPIISQTQSVSILFFLGGGSPFEDRARYHAFCKGVFYLCTIQSWCPTPATRTNYVTQQRAPVDEKNQRIKRKGKVGGGGVFL
jgi:hypothetical protein